jgi:putative membrane protein
MNREEFGREFDAFVTRNRFTIAVVFPLVGAVLLVASAQGLLPAVLAFNPYLVLAGVLVMRLPLVAGLFPLVDRRGALLLVALAGYAYGVEFVGATTGLPYGEFAYEVPLGPMLFDTIPLGLPVFFMPLVLNAYLLCLLLLGERARSPLVRVPVAVAAVVAVDLVLDPAAVALGFWTYESGSYYGVPWLNFAGWVLSATVATALVDAAFDRAALLDRVRSCPFVLDDLVSFVLLWGVINAFYRAWIPVAVAGLFAAGLFRLDRFDFAVFRRVPGRHSG